MKKRQRLCMPLFGDYKNKTYLRFAPESKVKKLIISKKQKKCITAVGAIEITV
jgi:hypothetical protein